MAWPQVNIAHLQLDLKRGGREQLIVWNPLKTSFMNMVSAAMRIAVSH